MPILDYMVLVRDVVSRIAIGEWGIARDADDSRHLRSLPRNCKIVEGA
jgi:hypothetical protein